MAGWGDFTNLATSALKNAQKRIDQALDIKDEGGEAGASATTAQASGGAGAGLESASAAAASLLASPAVAKLQDDFFSAFGIAGKAATDPAQSQEEQTKEAEGATEDPAKPSSERPEKAEPSDAAASSSSRNISKWLMGGSGVDAEGPAQPPAAQPPSRAKKSRALGQRRSGASEEARGGEKRSKTSSTQGASESPGQPSGTLEETSEADLLQLQTSQTEEERREPSELLLVATEAEPDDGPGEEAPDEELPTPKADGWDDVQWTASTLAQSTDILRSTSSTPDIADEHDNHEAPQAEAEFTMLPKAENDPMELSTAGWEQHDVDDTMVESEMGASLASSDTASAATVVAGAGTEAHRALAFSPSAASADTEHSLSEELALTHPPPELPEDPPREELGERAEVKTELEVETESSGSSPQAPPTTATPSPPDHGSEEETGGSDSLTSSFVRLTTASAQGSPPLSTQKSDTASLPAGYVSPTETAASSDIEIISNTGNDNGSERSWASSAPRAQASSSLKAQPSRQRRSGGGSDLVGKLMESLEAREKQNLEQSTRMMSLVEENEELRTKLAALGGEDAGAALANLREKFSSVCEERDAMRSRLEATSTAEARIGLLERQLREKDEQVNDLIQEGQTWSQKELKQGNVIKKLREKEKASEKAAEALKKRLEEMDSLREELKAKKQAEIRYDEAVHSLKAAAEKAERKQKTAELAASDAKDKAASTQASLEQAYAQIAQLSAGQADSQRKIEKLNSDVSASQEAQLKAALEEAEELRRRETAELARRAEELRASLERQTAEADAAEAVLRADVAGLQRRLAESETRNEELAGATTSATTPLLRQLDSLAASHAAQAGQWERLEADLYARLGAAEKRGLHAEAKEADAQAALLDLRSDLAKAQQETDIAKRRLDDLKADLEREKATRKQMEQKADAALREAQSLRDLHQGQLDDARQEKEFFAAQLRDESKSERAALELRIKDLSGQLEEKEAAVSSLRTQLLESATSVGAVPAPRPPSPNWSQRSGLEGWGGPGAGGQLGEWEVSDVSGTSYGGLVEALRARLQQRDGELGAVREELRGVAASRDAAAARVAKEASAAQRLAEAEERLSQTREQLRALDDSHAALLAMYGEKAELNEELRLDLQDLKAAYRQQIQDLLKPTQPQPQDSTAS